MAQEELQSLIQEAKRGNRTAQTTLMNLMWDRVYYFILSRVHNKHDAEDITIRTFTKVFQKLKLYNNSFDFATWVRSIAYNTMVDFLRKKPNPKISLDDEFSNIDIESAVPTPEQDLIQKQSTTQLLQSIENLPKIYQDVIKLRYLEDKTYKEIAQELNLSMPNVKVRISRARKLLEEAMQKNQ